MSLPEKLIHFYRADDGVTPAKGSITWDGSPTITVNGVEPGEGPTVADVNPGVDGAAVVVRVKMKTASANISGDSHLFGPIYVCSEGVKVKVGDSVSLYATDWIVGDVLDFTGQFLNDMQRCGLLNEYHDPAIPEEPPVYPASGRIIKLASLPYGASYTTYDKTEVRQWIADTFDFVVNGGADTTFQSRDGYIYAIYVVAGTYITSTPEIRAFCDERGWLMDDMFSHMSVDYVPAKSLWKERDKFFALKGTADVSSDLYLTTGDTTASDTLSLGQYDPFDQINVELVTAGVGGSVNIQYWNGTTWADLTVADATSDLTVDGQISFTPPANWARNTVGTVNGYWVKIVPAGYSTAPVIKRMYADNWLAADNTMCRGWDATSETIINAGELIYNPTPPSTATAKFKHQGRTTGYWSPNQMRMEQTAYIGDVCLAGEYFIHRFNLSIEANPNANGIMWDTAYSTGSTWVKTPANALDYMDINYDRYPTHVAASAARYKYVVDAIHALHPDIFISGNLYSAPASFVAAGNANLLEYYQFASKSPGAVNRRITLDDAPVVKEDNKFRVYDGLRPENNPTGVKCVFMYDAGMLDYVTTTGHWDKANRDPMLCLAKHLIGQNENVYFCYHIQGNYDYCFSSEILVWKFETTLTSPLTIDLTSDVKTISAVDFSGLNVANSNLVSALKTNRAIKIGDDVLTLASKLSDTQITTKSMITSDYAEGTRVRTLGVVSWIDLQNNPPRCEDVYAWPSFYFPAMDVDVGVPDENGHNGGEHDLAWKTAAEIGGPNYTEIWRRDYTKAIVLCRSGNTTYSSHHPHYQTPCSPIDLGGTYYPLSADGTVGEGITSISLRAAEGAILLKSRT